MGIAEAIAKVAEPYERQARLWPALIAGLPAFVMVALLYGAAADIGEKALMIVASCGGLYLLSNICRELGKRLESHLFESWGGKPTTQLLRHRDATIEGVTKRRYQAFLATKIGAPFPDPASETQDPKAADDIYQSGVRWLLNQTRDAKTFGLLLQENITYGFRRNALGLKPIALLIAATTFGWVLAADNVISASAEYGIDLRALLNLPTPALITLAVAFVMFLVWCLFFTRESVRTAAFAYAETLLRACDVLNK